MGDIGQAVLAAQADRDKLDQLIQDYLPFIKKQLAGLTGLKLEYDDMLSLAMLTFSGCVQQYSLEKGSFLSFANTCIRNRLIDENRKQLRYHGKVVPLFQEGEDGGQDLDLEGDASLAAYQVEQERLALSHEIEAFSDEIRGLAIDFKDLPRICPKQDRSRRLCLQIAREIITAPPLYGELMEKGRIAQNELARRFGISSKTIEKHRKYIVALVVLIGGDYPLIQSYLQSM